MNQQEFNQWWADFKIRFPDAGNLWFAEGRSEPQQRVVLGGFAEVLADVALSEAMAANKAMQRGEGIGSKWDRDDIARKVRTTAINARRTSTWTGPNDDPYPQPKLQPLNLRGALADLVELQERGATREESLEFLRKRFPPERGDRQRRYSCAECLDDGRVEVWHYERLFLAQRDGIEAAMASPYKTSVMACSCSAGDKFASREIPLIRFDDRKHCLALRGDVESAQASATFTDWFETRNDVAKRANYEPAFARQEAF